MIENLQERIEYQNHCRVLQIRAIQKSFFEKGDEYAKLPDSGFEEFAVAMATPKFIHEHLVKSRPKVWEKIDQYSTSYITENLVGRVLNHLIKNAVQIGSKTASFELKTERDLLKYADLKKVYEGRDETLGDIMKEGEAQGIQKSLDLLSGDSPLAYWRKEIALKMLTLEETIDGGVMGKLQTKIPNVCVKYIYPRGESKPIVLIEVEPF